MDTIKKCCLVELIPLYHRVQLLTSKYLYTEVNLTDVFCDSNKHGQNPKRIPVCLQD